MKSIRELTSTNSYKWDQGTVLRSALFPVEKAVDDSVWDSGESGKLAETCSKVETGEYDLAA